MSRCVYADADRLGSCGQEGREGSGLLFAVRAAVRAAVISGDHQALRRLWAENGRKNDPRWRRVVLERARRKLAQGL